MLLNELNDENEINRRIEAIPERRVFHVSVGNMSVKEAQKYAGKWMVAYKKYMTVVEIETLSGGEVGGEISDVEYFLKKLYHSMHVPLPDSFDGLE